MLAAQDATGYDLWIGDVEVTSANASNVTGDGISGKVSFDAATRTLTLSNAKISGSKVTYQDGGGAYGQYGGTYYYYGILDESGNDLTVKLVGTNNLKQVDGSAGDFRHVYGISASADLTFAGSGSLSVINDCTDQNTGIDCGVFTVDSAASVKVTSTSSSYNDSNGLEVGKATIKGSLDVSAHAGTQRATALSSFKDVTVAKGGRLTAKADHGNYGMDAIVVRNDNRLVIDGYVQAESGEWGITCGAIVVGSTGELDVTGGDRALGPSTSVMLGSSKLKVMSWKEEISVSDIGMQQNIHIFMAKEANPMTVKAKAVEFYASDVKKADQTVKASKVFTVKKSQGKVTYKVSKYVTKKAKGKVSVAKSGKVTVKKGTPKGTYQLKVKVTAAGNAKYAKKSKAVGLTVTVK